MTEPAERALALWGLGGATSAFVSGRENRVYRVASRQGEFALRLKRPGYRSEAELVSELHWLDALDRAGLSVPRPQPSLSGAMLEKVDGQFADMVGWLPGRPLGTSGAPLQIENPQAVFRSIGRALARLHRASDDWVPPAGFVRWHWNLAGLLGEDPRGEDPRGVDPLWGRFWENPTLDPETRALLIRFRQAARRDLTAAPPPDYGLIHADLVRENLHLDGTTIRMLDFDDGGFGYRLFDIATVLIKNRAEPDYAGLEAALIGGYQGLRPLDTSLLDLFMALRAATYVGWIVPRLGEDGAAERNRRFIADARRLCAGYLGGGGAV